MACVLGEIARIMVENRRATRTRIRLSLGAQLALRTLASLLHPTYLIIRRRLYSVPVSEDFAHCRTRTSGRIDTCA